MDKFGKFEVRFEFWSFAPLPALFSIPSENKFSDGCASKAAPPQHRSISSVAFVEDSTLSDAFFEFQRQLGHSTSSVLHLRRAPAQQRAVGPPETLRFLEMCHSEFDLFTFSYFHICSFDFVLKSLRFGDFVTLKFGAWATSLAEALFEHVLVKRFKTLNKSINIYIYIENLNMLKSVECISLCTFTWQPQIGDQVSSSSDMRPVATWIWKPLEPFANKPQCHPNLHEASTLHVSNCFPCHVLSPTTVVRWVFRSFIVFW